MSFDDDLHDNIAKPDPKVRLIAIIPVVLIAGAMLAFMYGFRTEGRTYTTAPWRTHTIAEHSFVMTTPGMLMMINKEVDFDGEVVAGKSYVGADMGTDYSVTVAERPPSDKRSIEDVAKSLGVKTIVDVPGGGKSVDTDFVIEGQKTRARLIFKDRLMYQIMAAGPAKTYPEASADRFFASFKLSAP